MASTLVDFLQNQTFFSVCVKIMFDLMQKYKNDNGLIYKKMKNDKRFVRESLDYKFMFQHFPKITLAVEDKFFSAKNHLSLLFHNNLGFTFL